MPAGADTIALDAADTENDLAHGPTIFTVDLDRYLLWR
jgi:hypothetical protein